MRWNAPRTDWFANQPRLLSPEGGTLPEDQQAAYQLFEKHWDINLKDAALLSSPLVSSYHSRTARVKGEMCLGGY